MKKLLENIVRRISGLKIMYKLLLVYVIIGTLPLTLLSSYMIYSTKKMIMAQHNNQVAAENRRVRNILFNTIYLATNISDSILYDRDLIKLLKENYASEEAVYKAYRSYEAIDSIIKSYTEISNIQIYVTNKTLITSGSFVRVDGQTASSNWYKEVKDSPGKLLWVYDDTADAESSLRLIRRMPLSNTKDYAIMSISISTNYMRFIINSNSINTILGIDNAMSFYSNDYNEIGRPLKELYQTGNIQLNTPYTLKYQGKDTLAYSTLQNAPKSKSVFQITTFDPLAISHVTESILLNIKVILLSFMVPLLMIVGYSIAFNRRILILRREMNKIANGDFNIIDNFNSQDELGELFKDMQKTILSIQQLNTKIYEDKLLRQKLLNYQQQMEFNLLTNQINPHFLYNTLETIRMQLSINKEYDAARIVKQLGKFMRHNIEADNSLVLLSSELEYINIYMEIQHYRFGDRVNFQITQDNESAIKDYMILPLLIQPIVENAFVHGLEGKKAGGTVVIDITSSEEYLILSITDNGLGMSENTLNALLISINDPGNKSKSHIGLHNVQQRIKLFYGEKYGLQIKTMENQFTIITVYLPLQVDYDTLIKNGGLYHEIYNS
ncbi:two-component system, sensor histidine kinase YesM [Anaerocolumna jejuensis DSM 15929]|uniref:Two-component system, sensor histidine kinase YesM n=1 Tax=Anaerocolumna jejuensis DSM 15929 TaxID=1121322 RepID=A0A1M6XRR8_9FIRM|nr:histidine kinase [Anaerocolumna jejuensis]SHL08710.1 two-component system, sensor histidine kinase YesM [Anaerocolumna jejuensis DSM 15929]